MVWNGRVDRKFFRSCPSCFLHASRLGHGVSDDSVGSRPWDLGKMGASLHQRPLAQTPKLGYFQKYQGAAFQGRLWCGKLDVRKQGLVWVLVIVLTYEFGQIC